MLCSNLLSSILHGMKVNTSVSHLGIPGSNPSWVSFVDFFKKSPYMKGKNNPLPTEGFCLKLKGTLR